jgi:hypothetical protein
MVFLAAALVSAQRVFGGLIGRKIDGMRGSCNTVSATPAQTSA